MRVVRSLIVTGRRSAPPRGRSRRPAAPERRRRPWPPDLPPPLRAPQTSAEWQARFEAERRGNPLGRVEPPPPPPRGRGRDRDDHPLQKIGRRALGDHRAHTPRERQPRRKLQRHYQVSGNPFIRRRRPGGVEPRHRRRAWRESTQPGLASLAELL